MEEQKKKWWKKKWFIISIIAIIALFPIIINGLTFIPNFQVFEKPNSWTEVWAEYGGALLSAGIALVILYKQQKQNEEENEKNRLNNEKQNEINRILQINAIRYQQKYTWLMELKRSITNFRVVCDINVIFMLQDDIKNFYLTPGSNPNVLKEMRKRIVESLNSRFQQAKDAYLNVLLLYPQEEFLDEREKVYIKELELKFNLFTDAINDYKCIVVDYQHESLFSTYSSYEDRVSYIKIKIKERKEERKDFILYDILNDFKFEFYNNMSKIITRRYNIFKDENSQYNDTEKKLIQYEREKIDKLLEIENENK